MAILKNISLLFVCFSLLLGGVANAVMPCCLMNSEAPTAEMQIDGGKDMPCHETANKAADSDEQQAMDCSDCDCTHCVSTSALINHQSVTDSTVSGTKVTTTQKSIHSRQPDGVFHPPQAYLLSF